MTGRGSCSALDSISQACSSSPWTAIASKAATWNLSSGCAYHLSNSSSGASGEKASTSSDGSALSATSNSHCAAPGTSDSHASSGSEPASAAGIVRVGRDVTAWIGRAAGDPGRLAGPASMTPFPPTAKGHCTSIEDGSVWPLRLGLSAGAMTRVAKAAQSTAAPPKSTGPWASNVMSSTLQEEGRLTPGLGYGWEDAFRFISRYASSLTGTPGAGASTALGLSPFSPVACCAGPGGRVGSGLTCSTAVGLTSVSGSAQPAGETAARAATKYAPAVRCAVLSLR